VPVLGILSCMMLMFSLPTANWWRLLGWLLLGLIIYFAYGRNHSVMAAYTENEIAKHGISPGGSLARDVDPPNVKK
jgi:APA family basic amino acid/polyamine antiporter